ncbi:ABC transporter permease subunit [bacterium]|nr:ABC transporter permease subunit [bacterium]
MPYLLKLLIVLTFIIKMLQLLITSPLIAIVVLVVVVGMWKLFKPTVDSPIFQKRVRKFKRLKRGYFSFVFIVTLYILTFLLPFLVTDRALVVYYEKDVNGKMVGEYYFPCVKMYQGKFFNLDGRDKYKSPNYRNLKIKWEKEKSKNWVMLPIYPFSPNELLLLELSNETGKKVKAVKANTALSPEKKTAMLKVLEANRFPPTKPNFKSNILGTDDRGRDVFARLIYGFQISISFALMVTTITYIFGIFIGSLLGYYGGKFDLIMQRFVEIWSTIPFLYTIIIISSILVPNFWLLIGIMCLFKWMGMTYYIRAEFLREKAKDYVSAAISIGASDAKIIFKHILPNALTPVISFAPFSIVANISALVSLDFLGFGLPAPTPSWGELLVQGKANMLSPWLAGAPLGAMFITLMLVTFIGEAVREAFDPKEYSRLR